MTALSIPVALAIALRCAPAEDGMLVAIVRQESGLKGHTDLAKRRSPAAVAKDRAGRRVKMAREIVIREGGDPSPA